MGKKNRKGPSAKAKKAMYEKERGLAMRIYTAASQGDDDKIALTKNPLGYKDSNGRTPLHFAAHHGHVSTCKLLIQMSEKDAVNICDSEGASALLLAAAKGHTDVVRVLKDMGAKMDAAKLNGVNALHLAASGGYVSTVEWLLETLPATLANASSEMGTPMHFAAGYGHAEVCRALLDAQIDLHALNEDGITALVAATASNQVEIVEMMVNYEKTREGGDLLGLLMKRSKTGFMCLGVAAAGGSIEILKRIVAVVPSEMLSEIASAQNADADGQCPAEVAATAGHASAVDLLLPLTESDRVRKADGSRMNTTELLDKCMKVARDKEANRLSEMDQRIGVMSAFKEEGNDAFKNRDYAKAKSLYADGVATYEQSVKDSIFAPVSSETKDAVVFRARELASQLSSNASACCLMGEGRKGCRVLWSTLRKQASYDRNGQKRTTDSVNASPSLKCTQTPRKRFGTLAASKGNRRSIQKVKRRQENSELSTSSFSSRLPSGKRPQRWLKEMEVAHPRWHRTTFHLLLRSPLTCQGKRTRR